MLKTTRKLVGVLCAAAVLMWVSTLPTGQAGLWAAKDIAEEPETKPEVTGVGGVKLLPDKKGLEVQGEVCMEDGILDFLAVVRGGREYESVLALNCKPSALHAALLALGAKPGPTPAQIEFIKEQEKTAEKPEVRKKPEVSVKPGSKLLITVRWKTQEGKENEVPATSLLFNRKTGKVEPESSGWFFSGSYFGKTVEGETVYVADEDGAVVSVIQDSSAVINLGIYAGNPYDGPEQGFAPNKDKLPTVGTAVILHIEVVPEK